jgi:hypothetical protein
LLFFLSFLLFLDLLLNGIKSFLFFFFNLILLFYVQL